MNVIEHFNQLLSKFVLTTNLVAIGMMVACLAAFAWLLWEFRK